MFVAPLLRSSLTPIGSIYYPDSLEVQSILYFSRNLEKTASRLLSPLKICFFFLFFFVLFLRFWKFLMPLLRTSLIQIGSIRYPDSLGFQNSWNFSCNLEKCVSRLPSPFRITVLAVLIVPHPF